MSNVSWKKTELKKLCTRIGDGLHGTPKYSDSGIFFINGNNLDHGQIVINENTKTVSPEELEKNYIHLDENSLLMSINGTLGELAFYNGERVMLGKSAAYLNFKNPINRFYFYYFQLPEVQKYFWNVATGSTIKNLSLKSLQNFEVPVPEEFEWKGISSVLSSLDSKIDLNNRINAELEAMAKTIYDYWFVQFDFPISKELATQMGKPELEGRPYKSSGGEMVWNEKLRRLVPKGWEVKKLKDFGRTVTGKTPSSSNSNHFGASTPFFTPVDFNNSIKIQSHAARYLSTEGTLGLRNHLLPKGSIMITCIGSDMGKIAIASQDSVTNQQINSLIPSDIFLSEYLYQTIYLILPHLKKLGKSSSTVPIVNKSTLDSIYLLRPPIELLQRFSSITDPINQSIDNNVIQNQELASLRDWLLPMLMNGQVKVGEAMEYMQEEKPDRDQVGMAAERQGKYEVKG